jgi:hypothetical protein
VAAKKARKKAKKSRTKVKAPSSIKKKKGSSNASITKKRTVKKATVRRNRKPKPVAVKRRNIKKKVAPRRKKTPKKAAKKQTQQRKSVPRASISLETTKSVTRLFNSVRDKRVEAEANERQRIWDELEERKAIQEDGYQIITREIQTINNPSPETQAFIDNMVNTPEWYKEDGSQAAQDSRLRHRPDTDELLRRLGEHLYGSRAWIDEAHAIANENEVWTREVYTLFMSP